MITRFAVTNYRGFKDRLEWDLSHPRSYSNNPSAIKNGTIKNGLVYGPNGSGKSNLGLALFDIANHLSHKWKKPDYYVNFASGYNYTMPVEFEYSFRFDNVIVQYNYAKIAKEFKGEIVKEQLTVNGEELIYKDNDALILHPSFGLTVGAMDNLRQSANNISMVNFLLGSVPLPEKHVLLQLSDFVENMLFFRSLDNREFIGLHEDKSNIEEYIINNDLVDDFAFFLKDTSKQIFEFAKPSNGDNMLYCQMGENKMPFYQVASTGTLNLELQYYWLLEMKKAPFVFIDEFDAFYHHDLSYTISEILFHGDNQVFMTTHDTYLLSNDLLRPDCFFILDDNQISAICDLTDKEIRLGHNLEKLYRGGTFGS